MTENDYISREAVGYYIQSYIHEIITESGTDKNEHTNHILRSILNGIKTMSSAQPVNKVENKNHYEAVIKDLRKRLRYKKDKWIPTSEKLPMMGDTFLVTIEYNGEVIGVDAASYSPVEGYIDKHWDTFNDWKEDDDTCYHVTAWMPLPEGYQRIKEVKV